jgi:probable phosphomutase (TIGR03848 family)
MATRKVPQGTLVLLVRHGATPTTGQVMPGRAPGLHLSEAGQAQAAAVAERLSTLKLDAIYTSPLERARETAAPTAAATGLAPIEEPGLLEADVGEWTGKSLASLARLKEWRGVHGSPSTFRFPGGESLAELQARVVAVLDRVHATHPGGTVACFSHADPIRLGLVFALGAPLDAFGRVVVGTGSISALRFTTGHPPQVLSTNTLTGPLTGLATEG